ncbi:MAG: hypothetical protein R2713_17915 [Ilumatobacteraceae bacterium]
MAPEQLIATEFGTDFVRDELSAAEFRGAQPRRRAGDGRSRLSRPGLARDMSVTPLRLARHERAGTGSWTAFAWIAAVLVVAPVAFLATSVLRPNGRVWREQWSARLPGQLVDTVVLLVGVSIGALALGVSLAWLTSAYQFPAHGCSGWLLIALAMPSYVLRFVALSGVLPAASSGSPGRSNASGGRGSVTTPGSPRCARSAGRSWCSPWCSVRVPARPGGAARPGDPAQYEVARSLGAGPLETARRGAAQLRPPSPPVAVVMMETLTDFATVLAFGVDTVSVEVFRIWRGLRPRRGQRARDRAAFALVIIGLELGAAWPRPGSAWPVKRRAASSPGS